MKNTTCITPHPFTLTLPLAQARQTYFVAELDTELGQRTRISPCPASLMCTCVDPITRHWLMKEFKLTMESNGPVRSILINFFEAPTPWAQSLHVETGRTKAQAPPVNVPCHASCRAVETPQPILNLDFFLSDVESRRFAVYGPKTNQKKKFLLLSSSTTRAHLSGRASSAPARLVASSLLWFETRG